MKKKRKLKSDNTYSKAYLQGLGASLLVYIVICVFLPYSVIEEHALWIFLFSVFVGFRYNPSL